MMELFSLAADAIGLFFLCLFGYTGISKLRPANQSFYQGVLSNYGINLPELARVLVWVVGATELFCGLLMLVPQLRSVGLSMGIIILLAYWLLMAAQLWQGKLDMDCGCNGPGTKTLISPMLLYRNLVLVGLAVLALLVQQWAPAQDALVPVSSESLFYGPSYWYLVLALAAMLTIFNLSAGQLIANAQKLSQLKQL